MDSSNYSVQDHNKFVRYLRSHIFGSAKDLSAYWFDYRMLRTFIGLICLITVNMAAIIAGVLVIGVVLALLVATGLILRYLRTV
jgi:hypothetical protein